VELNENTKNISIAVGYRFQWFIYYGKWYVYFLCCHL